jgi:hypothetical protein
MTSAPHWSCRSPFEDDVAERVDRRHAALGRDGRDAPVLQLRGALGLREAQHDLVPLARERGDEPARKAAQLLAERRVAEHPHALLARLGHDRAPERIVVEPEAGLREVEAELERPAADLRTTFTPLACQRWASSRHASAWSGTNVVWRSGAQTDGLAARARELRVARDLGELVLRSIRR